MTLVDLDAAALLLLAIKVVVLFATAWLVLSIARRAAPATRHGIASVALAGGLVIPVLALLVPVWQVLPSPHSAHGADPSVAPHATAGATGSFDVNKSIGDELFAANLPATPAPVRVPAPTIGLDAIHLAWLWGAVTVVLLAGLFVRIVRTNRAAHRARRFDDSVWHARLDAARKTLGIERRVELRIARSGDMPFAWGLRRAVIVLPDEARRWDDERARAVLGHELAHVARRDVWTILASRTTCALHWFNPLAWCLYRVQRRESERACDRLALSLGLQPADYANHLLETAVAARSSHALAPVMAAPSEIEGRIMAILGSPRSTQNRSHTLAPWILGLGLAVPLASAGWSSGAQEVRSQDKTEYASDSAAFLQRLKDLKVDPNDVDAVLEYAYDDSALTRGACLWALGRKEDPRAVDPLIDGLVDDDAKVREWAARGFGVRRKGDERAVTPLALAATDGEAEVRQWVVRTLPGLAGTKAASAVEGRLKDGHAEVRQWAVRALPRTHAKLEPVVLRPLFQDADAEVRQWAVRVAGERQVAGVGLDLAERLVDKDHEVREWAVRTLGQIGDPTPVPRLIEATGDADAQVREWAIRGLGAIGDARMVAPLIHASRDTSADVREWAVRTLGEHGDPAATSAIEERLDDDNEEVREWARRALEQLVD